MGNNEFKRIRERVDNYVDKKLHAKVDSKLVAMNPVKFFLQDIVNGSFSNAEEAKKDYINNIYGDEKKVRKAYNKPNRIKDMRDPHDKVTKIFITPYPIPDMDYVPNYDRSDDEANNEQPDTTDIPDLESEKSAEQRRNQSAKGLTPEQMLSRPPISSAQLKAGNYSEKLKNEIRQLLYSLYK